MAAAPHLLIFGASARAAAFSALRAGLQPWCADLFADADLQRRCPVMRVPGKTYPQCFLDVAPTGLPGPWMYTGGLENARSVVAALSRQRVLWGNDEHVLELSRNPWYVHGLLKGRGLPCPAIWPSSTAATPRRGRWVLKPLASSGGAHIVFWDHAAFGKRNLSRTYLQAYVEGDPCAAIYVGDAGRAVLLGVTRQLVGEPWLNAAPFHYGGSIGPLELEPPARQAFEQLGDALATDCHLRGLFGVDCILAEGIPYPVEVNPRYTASVEVLEYATGLQALALHRGVCDQQPDLRARSASEGSASPSLALRARRSVVGKAILFADASLTFPEDGPWMETLRHPADIHQLPAFADIPHAGQRIEGGRPILTFFAAAPSVAECRRELQQVAVQLTGIFNSEQAK